MVQGRPRPARLCTPAASLGRAYFVSTCNYLACRFSSAVEQRFCNSLIDVRSGYVLYQEALIYWAFLRLRNRDSTSNTDPYQAIG